MALNPYELARKDEARREFDFEHSGVTWRLRVPDEVQFLSLVGSIPAEQAGSLPKLAATFVPACLVGWRGIKESDIDSDLGHDPLAFDKALVIAVLNRYPGVVIPAYLELDRRFYEARKSKEVELKN